MRRHAPKQPTKAALRQALSALLIMRDRLDNVDTASLARSYGMPETQVAEMIADELRRRERAA